MIGKLLNKDEVYAAMVLALSGTVMVLVAKGEGPLSLERVVSRVLPDPVRRGAVGMHSDASAPDPDRQVAA